MPSTTQGAGADSPVSSVCRMGAGSASPVVSITTRRNPGHLPTGAPLEQRAKARQHVFANGAAQAARGEQEDVVVERFEQEMVDTDLAEFIDEDGSLGHPGMLEQRVQERRLAAAEESGDDGDGGLRFRGGVVH